jgi:PAS domain S-box-containing protein
VRLTVKIAALTTAVVASSSAASLWISDRALHAQLLRSLELSAREVLVESSSTNVSDSLQRRDERKLLPRLQEIQRRLGAEFVAALEPDGRAVAHTNVAEAGRPLRPSGPLLHVSAPVRRHNEDFLDAVLYDESDLAGRLVAGLPLTKVAAVRADVMRRNATASVAINLLTVLLIVLTLKGLLRPVGTLLKATHRVGSGERGVAVPLAHRDELGELCRGFNAMVTDLDRTTLSRNALDAILASLQEMLIVTDPRGAILRVNPAAEAAMALSSQQLNGRQIQDFVDGLIARESGALLESQRSEVSIQRPDGTLISAQQTVSAIRRKDGALESLIFTLRDVTERNKAEKALNRLGRVLDESPNEIYMFDAQTLRFTMVNASAQRNLGYALSELREMTPLDIKPKLPREQFERLLKSLGGGSREALMFETDHRRKNGSLYPVEVRLHLSAMDSSPVFVAIIQDISERKLLESRMIQSEKLSAVGQLAAGVAHEINNPLGVIMGFSQSVLKRMEPGHPWLKPLQAIERESLRCKRLVQNLLTFSRQSRGRAEDVFDLAAAVRDTLTLVEAHAKVASCALTYETPEKPMRIRGDAQHLQQIIVNLCTNALDAIGQNGKVTVRLSPVSRAGAEWVQLEVADNGPGIPEDIQKRIFEPFFTTKEPGKGTGLGLALVAELVQRHGGSIDLDSKPGCGAAFRVEFPAAEREA